MLLDGPGLMELGVASPLARTQILGRIRDGDNALPFDIVMPVSAAEPGDLEARLSRALDRINELELQLCDQQFQDSGSPIAAASRVSSARVNDRNPAGPGTAATRTEMMEPAALFSQARGSQKKSMWGTWGRKSKGGQNM